MNRGNGNRFDGEIKSASVKQKELAAALGLTAARINQLIDEGIVIRDELSRSGRVMLFDSLRNYFLSRKTTDEGTNYWLEKARHEKVKRELSELKLRRESGELYEAGTVERVLAELMTTFKNKLEGTGHKLATRLEGLTATEICAIIDGEMEEVLKELSDDASSERYEDTEKGGDYHDGTRANQLGNETAI